MLNEAIAIRLNEIARTLEGAELCQGKFLERIDAATEILANISEQLSMETIQDVIRPEDVDDYLRNGWKYVDSFSNSRETFIVVEINKKERR